MRQQTIHIQYEGRVYSIVVYYGDNDVAQYYEIVQGKLNLSKMTYEQITQYIGLTVEQIEKLKSAIELQLAVQEGRT